MQKLAAQRFGESLNRVLGTAVRGLQGNAAVGERRADLDDRPAVPREHAAQGRQSAMHVSQVSHFGDPAELGGRRFLDGRKDGHHSVVDPNVDRT